MLSGLTQDQARELEERWRFWLRDEQHAPEGSWRIWLFLGGRGAGKTLAGAHWLASNIWAGHMRRVGLIGATHHDARSVMVEGESGLLQLCKDVTYEPTNRRLTFPSGAIVSVLSADEPDSLRGPQFDGLWLDEFAKWPEPQAALDMALMCLRLGADPRMAITTTPRAIPSVKALLASPDVVVTRSATEANAGNLAPGFLDTMRARYLGSRLGRQELDGEVIEDNDAACGGEAGSMPIACARHRNFRASSSRSIRRSVPTAMNAASWWRALPRTATSMCSPIVLPMA